MGVPLQGNGAARLFASLARNAHPLDRAIGFPTPIFFATRSPILPSAGAARVVRVAAARA
jgi:hypothetical protein